jgi:hypothetical protein
VRAVTRQGRDGDVEARAGWRVSTTAEAWPRPAATRRPSSVNTRHAYSSRQGRWQEAISQLPAAPAANGELDKAAANRLRTGGLAQAVTTEDLGDAEELERLSP